MSESQGKLNTGLSELQRAVAPELPGSGLPEQQVDQQIKRYALLGDAVTQARHDNIISPLPKQEPSGSDDYAASRIRTIRNRLFNLGYLGVDDKSALLDDAIKNGIRAFQNEAGLTQDAWVGEKTWSALQALVSFEDPTHLAGWFNNGKANPALIRATHLRLFALGLMADKPRDINRPVIRAGLGRFIEAINALGFDIEEISIENLMPDLHLDTLTLLFDEDDLIRRLGSSNSLMPKQHAGLQSAHVLLINIAKIELWLLGYDVDPRGFQHDDIAAARNSTELNDRSHLFKAMKKFWVDKGQPARSAMRSRSYLSQSFRTFFSELYQDTMLDQADELPDSDELFQHFSNDKNFIQTVWDHVKTFGARLWDGVKRMWSWFKRVIKSAARAAGEFMQGVSRIAYHYILKSYEAVQTVIKAVVHSIRFFTQPRLDISDRNRTVIFHDRDFDFKAAVHNDDTPEDIHAMAESLKLKSSIFKISCKIFSALLNVLKGVVQGVFTGWAALLMSLLKLYKRTAQWLPELIQAQLQDERINAALSAG